MRKIYIVVVCYPGFYFILIPFGVWGYEPGIPDSFAFDATVLLRDASVLLLTGVLCF